MTSLQHLQNLLGGKSTRLRTIRLYRLHSYTKSPLPLLEATIIKTKYISKHSPLSPVKPAHFLSLHLVTRKVTDQKFHKSFTDQIQHMITERKVLILEQKTIILPL